jgi:putative transposase
MRGLLSPGGLQRFVSMQSASRNQFSVPARFRSVLTIRYHRFEAFDEWKSATSVA